MELFDLDRFLTAQDSFDTYETALQEVKQSWKQTHWIWFIFPQIHGLGYSQTSKKYSFVSLLEAKAYFENDILRKRLYEITNALYEQEEDLLEVFGRTDCIKTLSCMTLFDIISPDDIFSKVIERYYDGRRCENTLEIVKKEKSYYQADSAFERNGVWNTPRAFMESGICESDALEYEQRLGTILDLLGRGETMLELVEHYLWTKDFSSYRVSGVESTVSGYLTSLIHEINSETSNEELVQDGVKTIRHLLDDDANAFTVAKVFDEFYKKYANNNDVTNVVQAYIESSKCIQVDVRNKRYYNNVERPQYTPAQIFSLKEDEIFVFGSNLQGAHGGGAARLARKKFCAKQGQGVGLQGHSYAIPTMQGGVETIKPYVDEFISFAQEHREYFFYVTRIGCGIAGFKDKEIASLFKEATTIDNICLPDTFVESL